MDTEREKIRERLRRLEGQRQLVKDELAQLCRAEVMHYEAYQDLKKRNLQLKDEIERLRRLLSPGIA